MTDESYEIVSAEIPKEILKEMHKGHDSVRRQGLDIDFSQYIVSCMMYGHHTFHKALALLSTMCEETARKKVKEKEEDE